MPQLNPGPWLTIFLMSWLIFLTTLTMKMNNLKCLNEPASHSIKKNKPQSWNWPWI
uniref:ATP synthase complex subunit 8 n=2 Tax=Onychodactylus TaxID=113381 RepID=A0A0E3DER4_9AMPH|nr:ATP synthase F0 subunit 8 [Onychodactylus zhaoermii]YP_626690.1 ATP synthase F0 subunit 8 [Onychodactylus fischeri]ABC56103.1 ATP synthase F0 subunit 8 [Onychodactylus fischeri]AIC83075.1 ATP synthase F0 subunit 8 [Onychodactylus zhaoermii]UHM25429.1 ATP synthase F0 subunit 8 [Onychodactylus zhaoermii]UHM25442.1 ATP synthase F0 subunit 8 [Onychodactylus zhaoermii]UHM25455.1 ATP synthase F0 subunit 8 [Onychodactylus zhaoermii]